MVGGGACPVGVCVWGGVPCRCGLGACSVGVCGGGGVQGGREWDACPACVCVGGGGDVLCIVLFFGGDGGCFVRCIVH